MESYHKTEDVLNDVEAKQVEEAAARPIVDSEISKHAPLHSQIAFGSIIVAKNLLTNEVLMVRLGMDDKSPFDNPECAQFMKVGGDKEVLRLSSSYTPFEQEGFTEENLALHGVDNVISVGHATVRAKSINVTFLPASNKLVFHSSGKNEVYGDIFSYGSWSSEDKRADFQSHGMAVEASLRERESKESSPGNGAGHSAPVTQPGPAAAAAQNSPSALESKKSQPPQSAVGIDFTKGAEAITEWLKAKGWNPPGTAMASKAAHLRLEAEQRKGTAPEEATYLAIAAGVLAVRMEKDTGPKLRPILDHAQLQDVQEAAVKAGARSAAQEVAQNKNPGFSDVDAVLKDALNVALKAAAFRDVASRAGQLVRIDLRERDSKEASPRDRVGDSAPVMHPGPAASAAAAARNAPSELESKKSQSAQSADVFVNNFKNGVEAITRWLEKKNWVSKYTHIAKTAAHVRLEAELRAGTPFQEATHLAIAAGVLAVRMLEKDGIDVSKVLPKELKGLQEAAVRAGARSAAQEVAQNKNPGFSAVNAVLQGALKVAPGALGRFLDSLRAGTSPGDAAAALAPGAGSGPG